MAERPGGADDDVLQLDRVGRAVDRLRADGYFLGGLLPRWFNDDGLLLQRVLRRPNCGRPNWEGIQLQFDRARSILEHVRRDWERPGRG